MLEVYGIPNCDTVKKALAWLKKNNITFQFHDFKTEGVSVKKLDYWINKKGLEIVLNKKSTTWRNLPVEVQKRMNNRKDAVKVMQEQTSIIKRPVVESGNDVSIGFSEDTFSKYLMK